MREKTVLDGEDMRRMLVRISHEIVERTGTEPLAIVGIHRRGAPLARRLHALVDALVDDDVRLGFVDVTRHRDDSYLRDPAPHPGAHGTRIDFEIDDCTVVLVDDVLFTGRTVRAALDALLEHGRPARVQLAVIADRGHRELPIRPDYVGKNLPTAREERVNVLVTEIDGIDAVNIPHQRQEVGV